MADTPLNHQLIMKINTLAVFLAKNIALALNLNK